VNPLAIIPVIDLRAGQVVHARFGQRSLYRPLQSILCDGSAPTRVIEGLLRFYPFATVYAADLDAIEGTGSNAETLARLNRNFPGLRFWVDAGFRNYSECGAWLARGIGELVLGSEAQADATTLRLLLNSGQADRTILSLDFAGEELLGPSELLDPALWPARVIAMTLARVGSDQGPDLVRLGQMLRGAPGRQIFAAGGVRDAEDLTALAEAGAAGVLVASALHAGRIGREDMARLTALQPGIASIPSTSVGRQS
jgi:phosphoribosylformimino-5-aminoimidazole carboxamide ribotide isomerase